MTINKIILNVSALSLSLSLPLRTVFDMPLKKEFFFFENFGRRRSVDKKKTKKVCLAVLGAWRRCTPQMAHVTLRKWKRISLRKPKWTCELEVFFFFFIAMQERDISKKRERSPGRGKKNWEKKLKIVPKKKSANTAYPKENGGPLGVIDSDGPHWCKNFKKTHIKQQTKAIQLKNKKKRCGAGTVAEHCWWMWRRTNLVIIIFPINERFFFFYFFFFWIICIF